MHVRYPVQSTMRMHVHKDVHPPPYEPAHIQLGVRSNP